MKLVKKLRNKTGALVVKPRYSPGVLMILAVGAVLALLAAGYGLYGEGLSRAGFDRAAAVSRLDADAARIAALRAENQKLQGQLAQAQRDLQMNQAAYHDLNKSLSASLSSALKLQEEVDFYRGIVAPTDKEAGVTIRNFAVEPVTGGDNAGGDNEYEYRLVLIQALIHARKVVGRIHFDISGEQGGKTASVSFPPPVDKPIFINFKYFQDVEGKLELPAGFAPTGVTVSLLTQGQGKIERSFPWPNHTAS